MKKFINLIPVICLTAWLGCGGGGGDTKSKGVIAYSPLTLSNPFFKVIGDHIKAEAEKNGYTVRIVDPNMDVKKQSDQMDDFISSGVTAIIRAVRPTVCRPVGASSEQSRHSGVHGGCQVCGGKC